MVVLRDGIQSADAIERLAQAGIIRPETPFAPDQVQPASLDLRLGKRAYRVRASFLPGRNHTVRDRLVQLSYHEIDLSGGAILETGSVYIAELQESLSLPPDVSAAANPKSSTGRIDVFTRVITDRSQEFDTIGAGYQGHLFAEISPRTFPVLVRTGTRLSQLRLRKGVVRLNDTELHALHSRERIVTSAEPSIQDGVAVSVDLAGFGDQNLIGYRAKRHTGLVDVDKPGSCLASDFWEPLYANAGRTLILDPGQFYILASKEAVHVPPDYAAEMVPFDPLVGEFRVHYAGFFDPGSATRPLAATAPAPCWKCAPEMCPSSWKTGKSLAGWCMSEWRSARPCSRRRLGIQLSGPKPEALQTLPLSGLAARA